tara:strand:+ start:234 stop:860 length:627 start_codon:yes stop_codon:yes gene_type:complete
MSLVNALTNDLNHFKEPFNHWTLENPLSETLIDEVYDIKFPEGDVIFDGTRAGDKTGNNLLSKLRVFITKENSSDYPELYNLVKEMQSKECTDLISKMINRNLSNSFVRVEVIADKNGFWLEPHCDIKEKLMSSILFVNRYGENENLGTDFYTPDLKVAKTLPYRNNFGYIFTSEKDSWHGLEKKYIKNERRCLQLNYVTFETEWPVY